MKFDESILVKQLADPATRRKAFAEVVSHYNRTLYWQIRHLVTYHEDADDVLQNTFLKAWASLENFRGDSKLSTWLYRIAYNESVTHINRSRSHAASSLDTSVDSDDSSEMSIVDSLVGDEYFDGDEAQALLQEAISLLPAKQKAVFTMKYFDEMKYDQMAEITGTSVGALKASYHLAVKKITDFLNRHE